VSKGENWIGNFISGAHRTKLSVQSLAREAQWEQGGFKLSSPAFADGGVLDPSFSAYEEDAVAPPLEWTAPPPGTMELALIVEDADSAGERADCHWLVWGLPGQKGKLLEGETPPRTGKNARGNSEWLLPSPSDSDGERRYVFQLFALDLPLTLMPGATREQLHQAMDGHVLAVSLLTGRFAAPEEGDSGWDVEDTS
jgi:Raf kinase inhibitor-like YbhB/YbcL family protein